MGAEIGNSIVLPEFWPFPGRLGLSKYLLHCEVFYGASPFRNELCPERWWGDDDVHSVFVCVCSGGGRKRSMYSD